MICTDVMEFLQTRKIIFSLRIRFPQIENGDRLQEKCRIEEKSKFGSVLIEFRNWYSSNVLKCIERKCKYFYMQSDHSLSIKRKLFQDNILHHGRIFQSRHLGILMHLQTNKNFGKIEQIGQTSNLHLWFCVCDIQTTYWSESRPNNAIHDYYALKQRPGSEGCWHILSAKTFDFQLSWPHTLLHPPFHIEIIPVWITGPWCKMLIKPNCNHKVGKNVNVGGVRAIFF